MNKSEKPTDEFTQQNETFTRGNPFPGLRPFNEDEDYLFFGRDAQIDALLTRLRTTRFLVVAGGSGSGKSSLVKCGLLPSLHSGFMTSAGSRWRVAVMRPGINPIDNLARAITTPGILNNEVEDLAYISCKTTLRRSDRGLIEAVTQSRLPHEENILIVVDQFEELFRFENIEYHGHSRKTEAAAFINLLLCAVSENTVPIYIVLTMRSDFISDCTKYHGLPEALNAGQYLVPRMTREQAREAIQGPIAVCGGQITHRLESRILNDLGDNPDQLPIMQHALMRSWAYWENNRSKDDEPLDLSHYLAIGGMDNALSIHAEEAYSELTKKVQQEHCKYIFKALTEKSTGGRGIRHPMKISELASHVNAPEDVCIRVIDTFRKPGRSFLMPSSEHVLSSESVIDLSHESLMRVWSRLHKWVDEECQSAEMYKRLCDAAEQHRKGAGGLLQNPQLQVVLNWCTSNRINTVWAQRYNTNYEQAIYFLFDSEEKEKLRIAGKEKRNLALGFIVVLFVALVVAGYGWYIVKKEKGKATTELNEQATALDEQATKALEAQTAALNEQATKALEAQTAELNEQAAKALEAQTAALNKQATKALMARAAELNEQATMALDAQAAELNEQAKRALEAQEKKLNEQKRALEKQATVDAHRLHTLMAQKLAIQSIQLTQNGINDTSIQLALHAYFMNGEKTVPNQVNAIYDALDKNAGQHSNILKGNFDYYVISYNPLGNLFACSVNFRKVLIYSPGDSSYKLQITIPKESQINVICPLNGTSQFLVGTKDGTLYKTKYPDSSLTLLQLQHKNNMRLPKSELLSLKSFNTSNVTFICAGYKDGIVIFSLTNDLLKLIYSKTKQNMSCCDAFYDKDSNTVSFACGLNDSIIIKKYIISSNMLTVEKSFSATPSKIATISFDNYGKQLAYGCESGKVIVLSSVHDTIGQILSGHEGAITSVQFSHDDSLLVSTSYDKSARIWPVKEGNHKLNESLRLAEDGIVFDAQFHPQVDSVVIVGKGGIIHGWATKSSVLAKQLCLKVKEPFDSLMQENIIGFKVKYSEPNCLFQQKNVTGDYSEQ